MKNKNFPVKEKETFLKLHSTTEVEDHKISGKQYSNMASIKWVNSDGMSKQIFLHTPCFSATIFGCYSHKCYQIVQMFYQGMLLPKKPLRNF